MERAILLSAAYGWFAGLLVVMILVTALFGLILFIALKPIKKDELEETSATKKLKRRETELTIELLKNKDDKRKSDELIGQLREVQSAEKIVGELMEDEEREAQPAKDAAPAKRVPPQRAARPQQAPARGAAPNRAPDASAPHTAPASTSPNAAAPVRTPEAPARDAGSQASQAADENNKNQ